MNNAPQLTSADLDQMTTRDEWEGFGYLGGRQIAIEEGKTELVAKADAMALENANRAGWTADQLFDRWANQKVGRWYGDCWFGSNGHHAEKYLPSR